ncbi:MAG: ribonuclease Z [Bacteroidetes bacterium]|nr:ribonuclease Z [Bacteroidota bacterium]
MFGVTILGNNSAVPAFNRHPTSQLVTLNDQLFLIDCGEGTQTQITRYKIRQSKIGYIFISHLHGDHYFGLIGLITTMGLLGRKQILHIYGPAQLQDIIHLQLSVANTILPFELAFHALETESIIVDHPKFKVSCFATQHRIPCWGFIFSEKKMPRKIDRVKCLEFEIPSAFYDQIKNGQDYYKKNGELIKNEWVSFANTPSRSYAFCADSLYDESIVNKVAKVNLLYHETTYLKDMELRAAERFHSTTIQAAAIANKANVGKLLIGHFSSKYEDLADFLTETAADFQQTDLAIEGVTFLIK